MATEESETVKGTESDVDEIKVLVEFARNYDVIDGLPEQWKFKHADIEFGTFHSLRQNEIIEEHERSMGKEKTWTYTDTTESLLDRVTGIMAREIDQMSAKEVRILMNNAELIRDELPQDTEETFEASDVGMRGRTPEGLWNHGFIECDEERNGYANKWSITSRTEAVQEFLTLYYN